MLKSISYVVVVVCLACSPPSGRKAENAAGTVAIVQTGDVETGKVLFQTCATCHGNEAQGNEALHAPGLTNTDSWYLERQLKYFQNDIRGNSPDDPMGRQMAAMAKNLKDTVEIKHLIAYINTLADIRPYKAVEGDISKGQRIYETVCGSCHGPNGKGNELMSAPGLQGLEDWYIQNQVEKFKAGIRGNHPKDIYGAQMVQMMTLVKDEKSIADVIAYIRSTAETASE
jgi:cytochrome c oxidase subunit II